MRKAKVLLVALLLLAPSPFGALSPFAAEKWEGIYRVEGKNPDGTSYTGALQIEKVPETVFYQLTWLQDADGGAQQMIAFAYEHEKLLVTIGGNMLMLASFTKDGGLWLVPNQGLAKPLTETWERSKAKSLKEALKPVRPTNHPPVAGEHVIVARLGR